MAAILDFPLLRLYATDFEEVPPEILMSRVSTELIEIKILHTLNLLRVYRAEPGLLTHLHTFT